MNANFKRRVEKLEEKLQVNQNFTEKEWGWIRCCQDHFGDTATPEEIMSRPYKNFMELVDFVNQEEKENRNEYSN